MVGLNRRFSPMVRAIKEAIGQNVPCVLNYRVNPGYISRSSWTHDPSEGGGMLVGEMCHFLDVMQFLVGSRPTTVYASAASLDSTDIEETDNISVVVSYANGSVGTLTYSTLGDKRAPKERLEALAGGTLAVLDDFRRLKISGRQKTIRKRSANQDKGQLEMLRQTIDAFRGVRATPIVYDELVDVMKVVFLAQDSVRTGEVQRISPSIMTMAVAG